MVAKCATRQNRRLSIDIRIDQIQREIPPEAITKKAFSHLDSSLCIFALQSETYSTTAINTVSLKKRFCKKKSLVVSVRTFSSLPCEEDVADNNPSFFGSFPTNALFDSIEDNLSESFPIFLQIKKFSHQNGILKTYSRETIKIYIND